MLGRLHEVSGDAASVMMFGHNPGLETLAGLLIGDGREDLRRRVAAKIPTGVLANLAFDEDWSDLAPADATLVAFVVPREL